MESFLCASASSSSPTVFIFYIYSTDSRSGASRPFCTLPGHETKALPSWWVKDLRMDHDERRAGWLVGCLSTPSISRSASIRATESVRCSTWWWEMQWVGTVPSSSNTHTHNTHLPPRTGIWQIPRKEKVHTTTSFPLPLFQSRRWPWGRTKTRLLLCINYWHILITI